MEKLRERLFNLTRTKSESSLILTKDTQYTKDAKDVAKYVIPNNNNNSIFCI
jgi:hypothetical protein